MTATQDKRRHALLREIAMFGVACRSAEHKRCGNRPDDEARAESVARIRYESAQSMIDELLAESTARLSRAESALHEAARLRSTLFAIKQAAKHGTIADVLQAIEDHEAAP